MSKAMIKRPNVLFLLTDDQRHDTIHGLGNDIIKNISLSDKANIEVNNIASPK